MSVRNFKELIAWQKAMDLAEQVYKTTKAFPSFEQYCLTFQIRKSAISVPSNIAEGQGRETTRDFLHFLSIALGSLQELETQMLLAGRLLYVDSIILRDFEEKKTELVRIMHGLSNSLKNSELSSG